MSNFADNIIDQNGQQVYLEDKHLNDQTSQTAIATTDAVMLKDTNGEYHSIAKASFNEAVRASLGSILTNFDKGSSITRIPGIDSNNDLGSVTAANLASVLGGLQWKGAVEDNIDNLEVGLYTFENASGIIDPTTPPTGALIVLKGSPLRTYHMGGIQIVFSSTYSTKCIYYRMKWVYDTWTRWAKIQATEIID